METEKLISDIINLPTSYYDVGNISFYSLLNGTGYFELFDQVPENRILEQLIKHPEWVEQWLNWSDNKRSGSGWYFTQGSSGKYIIGYYPPTENNKAREFFDSSEACAVFIKIVIEETRKL
jgi:hypothetical protein